MLRPTNEGSRTLALLLALLCLVSTGAAGLAESPSGYQTLADFAGAKIASQTGTVFDAYVDKKIDGVEHLYFNDMSAQAEAVRSGRAAGAAMDEPVARLLVAHQPDLAIFPEVIDNDTYGFAFRKGDPLVEKASEVIRRLDADGTADEMAARWFAGSDEGKVLPELTYRDDFDGSAGILRFGYDPVVEPMVYTGEGGVPIGYDIEILMRIAYELNMTLELVPTSLSARIEALNGDVIDVAGCCLSITEERKKSVDFTDPYYIGGMVLVVRKADMPAGTKAADGEINSIDSLIGRKVGILTGSSFDAVLRDTVPDAIPEYYQSFTDMMSALEARNIDAYLTDEPLARVSALRNPAQRYLDEPLVEQAYAAMFAKESQTLCDDFNEGLAQLYADGTVARLEEKWFSLDDEVKQAEPVDPVDGAKGTVRLVTDPLSEPFAYIKNEELIGYDLDIARMAFARMGYHVETTAMDFSGVIPSIVSGKYDIAVGCLTITEERKQSVLFSEPLYHGGVVAVVRNTAAPAAALGFWESLADSFNKTFIVENRYKLILGGLWVTLQISVLSALFGTFLGFGLCMLRRARNGLLSGIARAIIRLVQGIPMVVTLLILAYIVFRRSSLDTLWIAVIGFSVNFAAYAAEMMRTGIDAVDHGQLEAAAALGFGPVKIFSKITFPQAARHTLPVYKGEIISLVKSSSIVGYIAIQDLTKASDIIRSRTFEAFFPLIATALIYFLLAWALTGLLGLVEIKIDPKRRKRVVKGVTPQ